MRSAEHAISDALAGLVLIAAGPDVGARLRAVLAPFHSLLERVVPFGLGVVPIENVSKRIETKWSLARHKITGGLVASA